MCSFSCPHFDMDSEDCRRLRRICVPGRPGCVLRTSVFAVPVEERIREREAERAARQQEAKTPRGRSE
ncbi:MAG: hypothetical protein U0736_24460 [Gemmataceae bacterium]